MVGGCGDGELVFHGYRISLWDDKNVLQIGKGNGHTTRTCTQCHGIVKFKNG